MRTRYATPDDARNARVGDAVGIPVIRVSRTIGDSMNLDSFTATQAAAYKFVRDYKGGEGVMLAYAKQKHDSRVLNNLIKAKALRVEGGEGSEKLFANDLTQKPAPKAAAAKAPDPEKEAARQKEKEAKQKLAEEKAAAKKAAAEKKAAELAAKQAERLAKAEAKAAAKAIRDAERAARPAKVGGPCFCGCGGIAAYKSKFLQGHDMKLRSAVQKWAAQESPTSTPTPFPTSPEVMKWIGEAHWATDAIRAWARA